MPIGGIQPLKYGQIGVRLYDRLWIIKFCHQMLFKSCPLQTDVNPYQECVTLSLITLLVFSTLVISTVLVYNPILLLQMAQMKTGERDFILKPKTHNFNTTRIRQLTKMVPLPRLHVGLGVGDGKRAVGWLMDFQLEKENGLGRMGEGLPKGHRFLFAHRSLGLAEGEEVRLLLDDSQAWALILQLAANTTSQADRKKTLSKIKSETSNTIPHGVFMVKEVFDVAKGKMGQNQADECIFLDINSAIQQMVKQTFPQSTMARLIEEPTFSLVEIATQAIINMPNRIEAYSNADTEEVIRNIQNYGQKIVLDMGFFAVGMEIPILAQLQTLQYLGMFIGVMLKSIIACLFLLSVLMLDATLRTGLDKQKADMSVLKVIGGSRLHVVCHVFGGAIRQVFFSNLIAYPSAYLTFKAIQVKATDLMGLEIDVGFTLQACLSAVFIGLLVPIIASLSPIKKLIEDTLSDGLGQGKANYAQTKTEIYLQGHQFPWGKVTFGIVATCYGLAVYYLLPRAMINMNLGLLITLFFIFLQGLLVGLVIISYSFEYLLEEFMANVLLFWADRTDYSLTVKNLSCHRMSNRRTSMIYALSVAFVIFIAIGFQLQIDTVEGGYSEWMKADLDIGGPSVNATFINSLLPRLPNVESLTFMSLPLQKWSERRGERILISDKAKINFISADILGIAGPLIRKETGSGREVLYSQAYPPHNIYTYLQSDSGQDTCIISEYMARRFGILDSSNHEFYINFYSNDRVRRVPINYSSVVSKRKGLTYTALSFIQSEIGISLETYKRITGLDNEQIPIHRAKMYVKDYSKLPQMLAFIRQEAIKADEYPRNINYLWQRTSHDKEYQKMKGMLSGIMMTLLVVILVLCFFSLLTTAHGNIRGQQREIAVLMVLGYQKTRIMKIYIFEVFVLVANSCLKGFAVGYIMAALMGLQRDLFQSVAISVTFRPDYLFIIFIFAVGSSILATYGALKQTLGMKITDLLIANK